jgi:putative transposase
VVQIRGVDPWNDVIKPVIDERDPPKATGRKRIDPRRALNGIIYQMRVSGSRQFGDDSSVHRTYQRWIKLGVLVEVWATLIEACAELGGGRLGVAVGRRGDGQGAFWGDQIGKNPTDRAKKGTKHPHDG